MYETLVPLNIKTLSVVYIHAPLLYISEKNLDYSRRYFWTLEYLV